MPKVVFVVCLLLAMLKPRNIGLFLILTSGEGLDFGTIGIGIIMILGEILLAFCIAAAAMGFYLLLSWKKTYNEFNDNYRKIKPSDFADFANALYACVLEFMVGEELTEEQAAFYDNHFPEGNDNLVQWEILCWASFLMLELLSIYGERLDFDEFESCDAVDFVEIDEILNGLNDACIDFAGVECPSSYAKDVIKAMEDVYETPLFQSIVLQIQKGLKDALEAAPDDYAKLRAEYQQYSIIPQEFAADLMEY